MRHVKTAKSDAESCTSRQLVGLRMPLAEHEECQRLANEDDRSVAQFTLMMYRLGLAAYKKSKAAKKARGTA